MQIKIHTLRTYARNHPYLMLCVLYVVLGVFERFFLIRKMNKSEIKIMLHPEDIKLWEEYPEGTFLWQHKKRAIRLSLSD